MKYVSEQNNGGGGDGKGNIQMDTPVCTTKLKKANGTNIFEAHVPLPYFPFLQFSARSGNYLKYFVFRSLFHYSFSK